MRGDSTLKDSWDCATLRIEVSRNLSVHSTLKVISLRKACSRRLLSREVVILVPRAENPTKALSNDSWKAAARWEVPANS